MTSLRAAARAVRSRLRRRRPRPVILMYHRVAGVHHDPWGLAVAPERFAAQMEFLKNYRQPMPMDELVTRLQTRTLPDDAAAVTFDDGYRDNLIHAEPILHAAGVPATLFLTTGALREPRPFWWDELAAMVLESPHPAECSVVCTRTPISLQWGPLEADDTAGTWRAAGGPQTLRQRSFLAIWIALQRASGNERARVMAQLRDALQPVPADLARPMTSDEIRALLARDAFALGAHSVTHAALTSVDPTERKREIAESRETCRALSGASVNGFAYPYGDADPATCADVAEAGFRWACSTRGAFLQHGAGDVYALPRIAVPNVGADELRAIVSA